MNERDIAIMEAKIKVHDKRILCAYLTPVEIIYLHNHGMQLIDSNQKQYEYAQDDKAKGITDSRWCYFTRKSKAVKE